jgi:hypothetical protein
LKKIILIPGLALCLSCNKTTITPFWEIPDPSLPEIAMIRTNPNLSTSVIYNPDTCKQIGDACGFFRLHAYSHGILRHGVLGEPDDYPASQEAAADCYAAKYGKPKEVYAAVQLLLDDDRHPGLKIHGDPAQRAELIKDCATQGENWTG